MALVEAPQPDLAKLVDHLKRNWTDQMDDQLVIDPAIYSSAEIAAAEREKVFGRVPVIIAHSTELAEPGSFITARLANNEAIVIRQQDGDVKAFVNACRHRGSILTEEQYGSCPRNRLQCPYHGWSYNLDGSLRSATHQVSFGEFEHIDSGLVQLPVEERHGFIWVIDRAGASIDVASWLGDEMDAIMSTYGIESKLCVKSGSFEVDSNWKMLQDAFLDGYHIQFVHKDTAAKLTYTNILTLEDYGTHTRFLSPRKSLGRLLDEREDSGGEPPTEDEIARHVNLSHGLLPNATLLYLPDHVQLLSFFPHPKDTSKCRMEIRLIVPTLEDSGWDEAKWNKIWDRNWQINLDVLRDEDFPISSGAQRAVESADAGLMLLGRNEIANHVFHRELKRLLEA